MWCGVVPRKYIRGLRGTCDNMDRPWKHPDHVALRREIRKWTEPWRRVREFPEGGFFVDDVGRKYVPASQRCLDARHDIGDMYEMVVPKGGMFPEVGERIAMRVHLEQVVFEGEVCDVEYKLRGRTGLCTFERR